MRTRSSGISTTTLTCSANSCFVTTVAVHDSIITSTERPITIIFAPVRIALSLENYLS